MAVDVVIPKIGESVTVAIISRLRVKVGEAVSEGLPVLEIDSDKASMEIPAPASGVLSELLVAEGDEVPIGAVVARITEGAVATPAAPEVKLAPVESRAGPAARVAAGEAGVDLATVAGTGPHGRITTGDVSRAVAAPAVAPVPAPVPAPTPAPTPPAAPRPTLSADRTTRVKMSPVRRTIARRLVEAQATAAMLTTFNEVDMGAVMELRKRYQDGFVKRHGTKLGFMSFFVKAAVDALKQFPAVNAEIAGDEIVYKQYYHIGVAVSGPKGLVVPVLRDADSLSFAEVEKGIAALGEKAKNNQLRPEDFEGGTFTISNGGIFGSMMSTPILNPPQVGILGMHNIVDRPMAVGGQVVIRPMMYLALTYDHRLIDGREAVSFLVRIKEAIEAPERMLIEV